MLCLCVRSDGPGPAAEEQRRAGGRPDGIQQGEQQGQGPRSQPAECPAGSREGEGQTRVHGDVLPDRCWSQY
eukprot:scaffold358081_cov31-Prasinocladus_malaysianus.AAC.1